MESHVPNTLFVGKVLLHFPQLESTNLCAQKMIATTKPSEGIVITTTDQTAGRGQVDSKWESEAGKNVTMSVIFYPHFLPIRKHFLLNQTIALAVKDAIADFVGAKVQLKWPNDIYIKDKKIGGILIQNTLSGTKIQSCIVGVGINVNQTHFLSDAPNPTSLQLETNQLFDLKAIINKLCQYLEFRYLQLKSAQYSILQQDYLQHLYRYQQLADYQCLDGTRFRGEITGVTADGRLKMQSTRGEETFDIKEIRFILD